MNAQNNELLRTKAAAALLSVSTTTLWRFEKTDPTFPKKVVMSARCVGFRKGELIEWMQSKQS